MGSSRIRFAARLDSGVGRPSSAAIWRVNTPACPMVMRGCVVMCSWPRTAPTPCYLVCKAGAASRLGLVQELQQNPRGVCDERLFDHGSGNRDLHATRQSDLPMLRQLPGGSLQIQVVVPDGYPQPTFAIEHDKAGKDTHWYSDVYDGLTISDIQGDPNDLRRDNVPAAEGVGWKCPIRGDHLVVQWRLGPPSNSFKPKPLRGSA